jgi:hypothetical protein
MTIYVVSLAIGDLCNSSKLAFATSETSKECEDAAKKLLQPIYTLIS